ISDEYKIAVLHFYSSFIFFFSSRRRHTRFSRDWSSDVCSSDLGSAIMLRAEKEGITSEQLIDNVRAEHTADFADFLVDFDNYHRSEERRVGKECRSRGSA